MAHKTVKLYIVIVHIKFRQIGVQLEVCFWSEYQSFVTSVELKLNNDNLKLCLHEVQIQAQFEIILIFACASTNRPNTKHEL